jgi:hypothetical protein
LEQGREKSRDFRESNERQNLMHLGRRLVLLFAIFLLPLPGTAVHRCTPSALPRGTARRLSTNTLPSSAASSPAYLPCSSKSRAALGTL